MTRSSKLTITIQYQALTQVNCM